ncbi:uncharacterized protein LOC114929489 [Nylanderia fulva]|uniref:uncharacterized protein LOC114929489 n=1 Tax=Nylanderia fulva TaxID=613905 RepID=UPI0010FBB18A|nr:uncharacterized protein LOC114929489 [Nylanderia fulva]
METTRDIKDITRYNPLTIEIPSKQSIVLINRDSSIDSLSKMQFCPAYHFCKELKRPYRLSRFDGNHDQQITAIHDLLQAIKEPAIRLIQLVVNDIDKQWKRDPDFQVRYPDSKRYKGSDKQHYESGLILATTSSSVCALCGVALHLKNPSEESGQLAFDEKRKDYHNRDCNIMLKAFNSAFF